MWPVCGVMMEGKIGRCSSASRQLSQTPHLHPFICSAVSGDTGISVCVGRQSLWFLSPDKWLKKKKNQDSQKKKMVGKTAGGNSGSDAQRASLFHTLKSDTLLSAVSRVTSEPDYSHTDKTRCPTSEEHSVTVEENTTRIILSVCLFGFQQK